MSFSVKVTMHVAPGYLEGDHDDDGQGGATRERARGAEREQWHLEPRRVALDAKVILTPPSIFYC